MIDALTGYEVVRWDLGWAFARDGNHFVVYFMPMPGEWEHSSRCKKSAFKLWESTVAHFKHYAYAENA